MTRSDIRGVMVGVECEWCGGTGIGGEADNPHDKRGTPVTLDCEACDGTGIASKCIPIAEFELMLDRDLLAEPGGWG